MALTLVWTKRAAQGFDNIVRYLEEHWTDKEVRNFIHESDEFFSLLSQYPELLHSGYWLLATGGWQVVPMLTFLNSLF
ncbi:MAG: hypothetical protein JST46_08675 [Bacteroidetes bacterium]|nr:hypothetical protein [Bacteroidota bacterium]